MQVSTDIIISADGTYAYTPNSGVAGGETDTFSYTISDGEATSTATLSVNVLAQGHANADNLTMGESAWSASTVFAWMLIPVNGPMYLT